MRLSNEQLLQQLDNLRDGRLSHRTAVGQVGLMVTMDTLISSSAGTELYYGWTISEQAGIYERTGVSGILRVSRQG